MPRQPRVFVEGFPFHVIQRGNNRQACFFEACDYEFYLECLQDASEKYECGVHAYVLMTNHVHLLVTPGSKNGLPRMMQSIGRRYVKWVNSHYKRSGTLWEGRYKASVVDSKCYLLACYRYIEMNPVRAGMVGAPYEYPWSSYQSNAGEIDNLWLDHHAEYLALGSSPMKRQRAYRALFDESSACHWITEKTLSELPVGDRRFQDQIEDMLDIKFNRERGGRPAKDENCL